MTQPRLPIQDRRILFVGGKGGVGKTTTTAALALGLAQAGERVLLVSTDPAHSLGDLFDRRIGDREVELHPNLMAMEVDPEREVDRYLERVTETMRTFVQPAMYGEIQRQMELTRHSPGAAEAALMDRVAELMGEVSSRYDRVLFDTAPTGHTLRLLALPEIMAAWTEGLLKSRKRSDSLGDALKRLTGGKAAGHSAAGRSEGGTGTAGPAGREASGKGDDLSWFDDVDEAPEDLRNRRIREVLLERRRRFSRARRILLDAGTTAFLLVLVPEKLPILESRKALEVLRAHKVPVAGLVVNRVLPEEPLGSFLESRRGQEAEYLARIDQEFGDLPRVRVPLLPRDVEGMGSLEEVAGHLFGD
jgi:arsenite/tail-anchored protein-transporting ATPase